MSKKTIRLTENGLRKMISEAVSKCLAETDDFIAHGGMATSNWGGTEIQLSDSGDSARLKDTHTGNITDWMEINFDEEGVAYVSDEQGNEHRLCDFMRY